MRKLLTALFTAAFLCLNIPAAALAAQGTDARAQKPSPPSLYSEAAVLMDCDTGQVLYGKRQTARMHPASITKIMTLLIAMEEGNPTDVVTMTDEGVWSVPRSTTHIALTPGEEITFEQLEYAMMVESDNDAANGIAIHLAGSLEAFAQKMNLRAEKIGAVNTHFNNPNGLPENNHYTCAYDMALITREAMTHPEFRTLAGTQHYEIPPTNKQPETRKLNNRQYMFTLNDTYPGAFAGKTGWSEESGKTLVTLAERDGVTLICVVMKPSGTVDGEFKDSTALLDYGFDNFQKVTIPQEQLPTRETEDGVWQLGKDLAILLPDAVPADSLKMELDGENMLQITAPESVKTFMDPQVASVPLTFVKARPAAAPASEPVQPGQSGPPKLPAFVKWTGAGLLALVLLLVLLRMIIRGHYAKKRRKQEAARQRRQMQARERIAARRAQQQVIDVTVDKKKQNRITVIDERET